jgi:predicted nucleotidyltransferase component of viral defense system
VTHQHEDVIRKVLGHINEQDESPYILKGGTALMLCYGLDRESEDIDLDAPSTMYRRLRRTFEDEIAGAADRHGFSYRIAKDTETVKRALIHYGGSKPLRVELSLRNRTIPEDDVAKVDGMRVYTLDALCQMKAAAYLSRDKVRDLYDLTFIIDRYFNSLSDTAKASVKRAFEYKDLAQFDYLVKTQHDELVDKDLLETRFLEAFDMLGLEKSSEWRLPGDIT